MLDLHCRVQIRFTEEGCTFDDPEVQARPDEKLSFVGAVPHAGVHEIYARLDVHLQANVDGEFAFVDVQAVH